MSDSTGKYTITGGSGDNTLKAGKQDSVVKGESGDDIIVGDACNHECKGLPKAGTVDLVTMIL